MKRELKVDIPGSLIYFNVSFSFKTDPDEKGTESNFTVTAVDCLRNRFKTDPDEKGTESFPSLPHSD